MFPGSFRIPIIRARLTIYRKIASGSFFAKSRFVYLPVEERKWYRRPALHVSRLKSSQRPARCAERILSLDKTQSRRTRDERNSNALLAHRSIEYFCTTCNDGRIVPCVIIFPLAESKWQEYMILHSIFEFGMKVKERIFGSAPPLKICHVMFIVQFFVFSHSVSFEHGDTFSFIRVMMCWLIPFHGEKQHTYSGAAKFRSSYLFEE